jgi:Crp-like helix-turn-helix domain
MSYARQFAPNLQRKRRSLLRCNMAEEGSIRSGKHDHPGSPAAHCGLVARLVGALSGISRQNANQCLKRLEREGLPRLEYGGVTILDIERLRSYGE